MTKRRMHNQFTHMPHSVDADREACGALAHFRNACSTSKDAMAKPSTAIMNRTLIQRTRSGRRSVRQLKPASLRLAAVHKKPMDAGRSASHTWQRTRHFSRSPYVVWKGLRHMLSGSSSSTPSSLHRNEQAGPQINTLRKWLQPARDAQQVSNRKQQHPPPPANSKQQHLTPPLPLSVPRTCTRHRMRGGRSRRQRWHSVGSSRGDRSPPGYGSPTCHTSGSRCRSRRACGTWCTSSGHLVPRSACPCPPGGRGTNNDRQVRV